MKLSISWIFDHIDADWKKQGINYLVEKFNKTSAEIEGFYKVKFDLEDFVLCKVDNIDDEKTTIFIPEWKKEEVLPTRNDQDDYNFKTNKEIFYLVKKDGNKIRWATLKDFGSDKDGYLTALDATNKDLNGDWRKNFENEDVIIEVDNKSITHRPDMWGHRGFAREIAATLDLKFFSSERFLEDKQVATYDKLAKPTKTNPISIEIQSPQACKRFAGIYFGSIKNKPSNFFITSRLLKVGVRPINGIVDVTNYLTLDWSQPVHAYDAQKIEGNTIIARFAKKSEKMILLDGNELELTNKDLVISDGKKPLCLAGVMGGMNSGINADTKAIFFESANFDSAYIRKTALRYKYRTESSMRFEKTLDPNQNIEGILRFLKLADDCNIQIDSAQEILSVGVPAKEKTLRVSHEYLEKGIGLTLQDYEVTIPLKRLDFKVEAEVIHPQENKIGKKMDKSITYSITIPTFRGSKDVQIKEDILEEVVRFYGFERIDLKLPKLEKIPADLSPVFRLRKIKQFLADCAGMMEVYNYALYDENFLNSLDLNNLKIAASIINPVSQDYKKLVSSLIPGLLKNVQENFVSVETLNFFEVAKIWMPTNKKENEGILEQTSLSGIFFEKRKEINFYDCKNYIIGLLRLLGINTQTLDWIKSDFLSTKPWASEYQTAGIYLNKKLIGIAGKIDSVFLSKLDVLPESDAFFFELDADFLINFVPEIKKMQPLSKFQETFVDLSVFVPLALTSKELECSLQKVNKLITKVDLKDFFENPKWPDKRSLAFRLWLNHPKKTLQKDEIEIVRQEAINAIEKLGAILR